LPHNRDASFAYHAPHFGYSITSRGGTSPTLSAQ